MKNINKKIAGWMFFIAIISIIAFPKFFDHQTTTIWLQFIAMMIAIGYMTDQEKRHGIKAENRKGQLEADHERR